MSDHVEEAAETDETQGAKPQSSEDPGEAEAEAAVSEGELESLDIEVEVDEITVLTQKVGELEEAKTTLHERWVRVSADLENVRKRSRREVSDARIEERSRVLRDMLPVIDNLERAVAHAQQNLDEQTKGIVDGVSLVLREFEQALARSEVKVIDALGKAFDPALHEAVAQAPSAEHEPGVVIEALQKGYTIGERLLRPTLAVVCVPGEVTKEEAKEQSEAAETSSGDGEAQE